MDESNSVMSFDFLLETSKIIYELNFINQKRQIEEFLRFRRKFLDENRDKKDKKQSKKESLADIEAEYATLESEEKKLREC